MIAFAAKALAVLLPAEWHPITSRLLASPLIESTCSLPSGFDPGTGGSDR